MCEQRSGKFELQEIAEAEHREDRLHAAEGQGRASRRRRTGKTWCMKGRYAGRRKKESTAFVRGDPEMRLCVGTGQCDV
jgi:hypothetical protein